MPGEDRFHPRAVARQLLEPAAQLLHRRVEHARHGAELVARRSRRSAASRSPSPYRRATAAIACTRRLRSAEKSHASTTATGAASANADQRAAPDAPQLLRDGGQRQRHADVRDLRDARRGTAAYSMSRSTVVL